MNDLRLAIAQMRSSADPWENLLQVESFIEEAAQEKVGLLCFPENVFFRRPRADLTDEYIFRVHLQKLEPHSEFTSAEEELLARIPLAVSLGSVPEKNPLHPRPFNAHCLVDQDASLTSYHKIHLFDFQGTAGIYKESNDVRRRSETKTALVKEESIGLFICYDLRFPELFRKLAVEDQAELLLVPAAFTLETGRAHWHSLLRSRAIENLCFVSAAGQWGSHKNNQGQDLFCYGHSLIISPWGEILAEGPETGDALLVADLKGSNLLRARARLPVFESIRL